MPYLKTHYGTWKNEDKLKPSAPNWHKSKPDLNKILRSTEDALTGVLWIDDSQIAKIEILKMYGKQPGALIEVDYLDEDKPNLDCFVDFLKG